MNTTHTDSSHDECILSELYSYYTLIEHMFSGHKVVTYSKEVPSLRVCDFGIVSKLD